MGPRETRSVDNVSPILYLFLSLYRSLQADGDKVVKGFAMFRVPRVGVEWTFLKAKKYVQVPNHS
jgi:hypothetical protein